MPHKHEPRDEFVHELERQIARDVRHRNRAVEAGGRSPWPRWKTAAAAAALVLVSMSIGAGAVMAAYQVQGNERRDLLTASYQKRADLAQQRLAIAEEQLRDVERRVAVGVANVFDRTDAQRKVHQATAQVTAIQLDLEEIRMGGREPNNDLSAPLVSGRDFVSARLRVDIQAVELGAELEDRRRLDLQKRAEIGTADPIDVATAEGRLLELKAGYENLRRKRDIRQRFVKGEIDAVETELRAQESDAEQRRKAAVAQIERARRQLEQMAKRVEVGVAPAIDLAKAKLRLQELETDVLKADVDLALVRRQLEQRKPK